MIALNRLSFSEKGKLSIFWKIFSEVSFKNAYLPFIMETFKFIMEAFVAIWRESNLF